MAYPSYNQKKKSWKTSTAAIIALLIAVGSGVLALMDDDPSTNPDIGAITAAATAVGLFFARDNDVSSEEAGAK